MAKKVKKPMTANQKAYKAQEKRIKRIMRDLAKYGFEFAPGYDPIPQKSSRITKKRIQQLKDIKPEVIRQQAIKVPSWYPARKTPPKKASPAQLPVLSKVVLNNVRKMISDWTPAPNWSEWFANEKRKDKNILENILEGAIRQEGEDVVAKRLEDQATEVQRIVEYVLYASGGKEGRQETQIQLQRFAEIVWGRSATIDESKQLTEAQEEFDWSSDDEDWNDLE